VAYASSLALWQRRTAELADVVVVPSRFAERRLLDLGAPLPAGRVRVLPPPVPLEPVGAGADDRGHALVVSRLAPEKGVDVAIEACLLAGRPLVVAGEGPELGRLRGLAEGGDVRFEGRVERARLAALRAGAAIALVPSRSAETFGIAAAEAMAAGLPVAASRIGALPELLDEMALVPPGDAVAMAEAIGRLAGDRELGARGRSRVAELCAPDVVAARLAAIYDEAGESAVPGDPS
jgi:glycosyltransferase involved in cell wall biosynthesis